MMRLARWLTPVLLFVTTVGLAPGRQEDAQASYREAVGHFNAGRIVEAREVLEKLIERHPRYFRAYSTYWDSVGKTKDVAAQQDAVRASVAILATVPRDGRSEDYYNAAMRGHRLLKKEDRAEVLRAEAIERFPRGKIAQQALLDEARNATDPVEACAKFQRYIEDFRENVSWVSLAASHKFDRMVQHGEYFSVDQLADAGRQLDRFTRDYVTTFGNPSRPLIELVKITSAFLERDPRRTIDFAEIGRTYALETAPTTDEFDETASACFDQFELLARTELDEWLPATKIGAQLFPASDPTREPPIYYGVPFTEADLRLAFGRALLATHRIVAAHEQLAYAAFLDDRRATMAEKARATHPLSDKDAAWLAERIATFETEGIGRRKVKLLETEESRPAPPFTLRDLNGETVALDGLRGRIVVASFWATWCGPCISELAELDRAVEHYADSDVTILAISIDAEKAKVAPFVEEKGYRFQVLYGDGTVEESYQTGSIPQLYVIDAKGRIRFHKTGFGEKRFHEALGWMIEAARKEPGQ